MKVSLENIEGVIVKDNETYILEDNKLFKILNGKKGDFYGKYENGKVVKEIEV